MVTDNKSRKMYGLLGRRINYSLSPIMHNAAFRHFNIPAEYEIFNVEQEDLDKFFRDRVLSGEISGFNVTVPYKIRMKEMLVKCETRKTDLSNKWVRFSGAVNTVKVGEEEISAYNTDMLGFGASLQEDLRYDPGVRNQIFVIGAGGAGRAVCVYLAVFRKPGDQIYVYDVEKKQLDSFKEIFDSNKAIVTRQQDSDVFCFVESEKDIPEKIEKCDLVINATPLGTREGDPLPIDPGLLNEGMMIYDLVYCRETELVKAAKEKGLDAAGGLGMLLDQGARAFEIWTEDSFDWDAESREKIKAVMKEAAVKELRDRKK